jgi:hypothetical protein
MPLARASRRGLVHSAAVLSAALLVGCGGDSTTNVAPDRKNSSARTVTVEPASIVFNARGATETLVATVRDAGGAIIDDAGVEWSTASSAVTLALPTVVAGGRGLAAAVTIPTGRQIIVIAASRGVATITARTGTASTQVTATVAPVPAQIVIAGGNGQSGTVGSELPQPLVIRVLDRLGNPIAAQTVTFATSPRDGSLSPGTTTTNGEGIASTTWTLGKTAGVQEVVVSVAGANISESFTATALAGPAANIVVHDGNDQTAPGLTTLPVAPSVRVTDQFDNPLEGVPIVFAVASGGGTVTGANVTSDASGIATVGSWRLGPVAGPNTLTASIAGNPQIATTFSATATGAAGFSITLRFLSAMTASQRAAFSSAAAKWADIITGDLTDVPASVAAGQCGTNSPALDETIDDVLIFATITSIDGPGRVLGSAGPCFTRSGTHGLTVIGEMLFDAADVSSLESNGSFTSVVVHEMGHVLGIGTFWPQFGLKNASIVGGTPLDTYFPGANSVAGFNAIGGNAYSSGLKVPVENSGDGGTINAHWRESVLRNELMTGFITTGSNPLSVLTVRSLQDLGYSVNAGAADPFFLSLSLMMRPDTGGVALTNDVRVGPVFTIDTNGRIGRIK